MIQLSLRLAPRTYVYVDCKDDRGNAWTHRVADPEAMIRLIETSLPGVKAEVRK